MTAVVPSCSGSSTEIVTSACASLVRVMSSTLPIGWPATSTWFPLTSWPPFSNMRWYLCPELPPNRTTSTSTNPTRRAPPVSDPGEPRSAPRSSRIAVQASPVRGRVPPPLSTTRALLLVHAGVVLSFPAAAATPRHDFSSQGILFLRAPGAGADNAVQMGAGDPISYSRGSRPVSPR